MIKAAKDHLSQIYQQNESRPARVADIPVNSSIKLGGAFSQSDVTLRDFGMTTARPGQSRERGLDEAARALDVDGDPDLVDWYDSGEFGFSVGSPPTFRDHSLRAVWEI